MAHPTNIFKTHGFILGLGGVHYPSTFFTGADQLPITIKIVVCAMLVLWACWLIYIVHAKVNRIKLKESKSSQFLFYFLALLLVLLSVVVVIPL